MNLKFRYSHDFSAQKPTEEEHLSDFISSKHFYDPFVLHVCINLSAAGTYQHRSEERRSSPISHSPFLVSSWQVTAITWARVMTRQTVIHEGSMSAGQTRGVLTISQRELSPRATASRRTNPSIPERNGLLDERLLRTANKLPPRSPPSLTLLLCHCCSSRPTSSSSSCSCLERCS